MFDNSGGTFKMLAKLLFWIGTIGSCIYCAWLLINHTAQSPTLLLAIGILIGGVVSSYLSSLLIYGLGELIESNMECRKELKKLNASISSITQKKV